MVRYLPDGWQAGLTMNGKSDCYGASHPFALRYRRAKGHLYEVIKFTFYPIPIKKFQVFCARSFLLRIHHSSSPFLLLHILV
jgi:hypothetical protein